MSGIHQLFIDKIRPILNESNPQSICDYGCGEGELLEELHLVKSDAKLTGIDYFSRFGADFQLPRTATHFVDRDQEEFAQLLGSECFDLIVSTFALHHFQYPVQELQQIAGLVKPGGVMVFLDHCFNTERQADVAKGLSTLISETIAALKGRYHRHHYTLKEIEDLMRSVPVEIVLSETFRHDLPETERLEHAQGFLELNRDAQKRLEASGTDFWKSIYLPLLRLEEQILTENGMDYGKMALLVLRKK